MTDHHDDANAEPQRIGDAIDSLGIKATLDPGTLVAGAVVLLKLLLPDGTTRLSVAHSDGLGWIERAGMLRVAEAIATGTAAAGHASGA